MSFKAPKPRIRQVLWRGWRRRCPHCGRGPLFETWFGLRAACPVCHLRYEQRAGDTWAFWILGDRVFVAALLVAIVVGFRSISALHVFGLFAIVAVPLVWTMPRRLGVCVGLDYLSRVYMGQPSEVPPAHADDRDDKLIDR